MLVLTALLSGLTAPVYAAEDGYQSWKKNPDQTITLIDPFHAPEGKSYTVGISKKSDLDGVCLHYGLGASVSALFAPSEDDYLAVIDATGTVTEYYGADEAQANMRLSSISCEKPAKKTIEKTSQKKRSKRKNRR